MVHFNMWKILLLLKIQKQTNMYQTSIEFPTVLALSLVGRRRDRKKYTQTNTV